MANLRINPKSGHKHLVSIHLIDRNGTVLVVLPRFILRIFDFGHGLGRAALFVQSHDMEPSRQLSMLEELSDGRLVVKLEKPFTASIEGAHVILETP